MTQREHVTVYWRIHIEVLNDTCESEEPQIENLCDELLDEIQDICDRFDNHGIMTVKIVQ